MCRTCRLCSSHYKQISLTLPRLLLTPSAKRIEDMCRTCRLCSSRYKQISLTLPRLLLPPSAKRIEDHVEHVVFILLPLIGQGSRPLLPIGRRNFANSTLAYFIIDQSSYALGISKPYSSKLIICCYWACNYTPHVISYGCKTGGLTYRRTFCSNRNEFLLFL